ncbi:MAG: hypothetical protein PHO82_11945, partial [Mesotoga sp.]|uniref:hypothetical protein n=1 Tax=Mesotoga sp. TaxID=2053577 RepID=UPI00260E138E
TILGQLTRLCSRYRMISMSFPDGFNNPLELIFGWRIIEQLASDNSSACGFSFAKTSGLFIKLH